MGAHGHPRVPVFDGATDVRAPTGSATLVSSLCRRRRLPPPRTPAPAGCFAGEESLSNCDACPFCGLPKTRLVDGARVAIRHPPCAICWSNNQIVKRCPRCRARERKIEWNESKLEVGELRDIAGDDRRVLRPLRSAMKTRCRRGRRRDAELDVLIFPVLHELHEHKEQEIVPRKERRGRRRRRGFYLRRQQPSLRQIARSIALVTRRPCSLDSVRRRLREYKKHIRNLRARFPPTADQF
jgi:hypothetical protein